MIENIKSNNRRCRNRINYITMLELINNYSTLEINIKLVFLKIKIKLNQ